MKFCNALVLYLFASTLSAAPDSTTIKVGMVYFYPPFVMSDGTGFDAQLLPLICNRLHDRCEIVSMNFSELYSALDNGKIDIAIGGITIDGSQPQNYIYSLPYLLSKGEFLIPKDSAIHSIDELKNQKIGIIKGSRDGDIFYEYLRIYYAKGFQFQLEEYDNTENLITALADGDISAVFTHESTVNYWKLNGGGQFKTIGNAMIVGDGIGIMSSPSHATLISKINQQILLLEQTNTYLNLYRTYFSYAK